MVLQQFICKNGCQTMDDIETLLNLIEKQNNRLEQLEKELEPIRKLGMPVEVLLAEWERLENLEDDTDCLKYRIKELEKENEELKANNYEIKTTYRKMAKHFENIGKQETAEYMLAQIEDVPVWVVDDEKDYIPKSKIREELRTLKNMLPTALHETSRAVFNGEMALLERILGEE